VTRFLEGFDIREVILGTIALYIVALALHFGKLQMPYLGFFANTFFTNEIVYHKSHVSITRDATIQSIAAKVNLLINHPYFKHVDTQLICNKQLCTVSFSSEYHWGEARWAKKWFDAAAY
jgi:hypothetical protein